MRFINGWVTIRPGQRDAFLDHFYGLLPFIRSLPGVVYFEIGPRHGHPDEVIITECFASDADHARMWSTPEFEQVGALMDRLVTARRFHVHHAGAFTSSEVKGDHPPALGTTSAP